MLIPININNSIQVNDLDIEILQFKNLGLKEEHIEEFLRKNIEIIIDDETLLVIGRQVRNVEKGRSDLTAIDEDGNLVLIEIKRDIDDIKMRKEPFEFQAIRYAASYAKIQDVDEAVEKIFAPYILKYNDEFELGELTPEEKGKRILNEFLEKNNALKTFNRKQRIILVASGFDAQTLSAVAWLIENGVDINCIEISPIKIGEQILLQSNQILPLQKLDDYYVEIEDKKVATSGQSKITRKYLPRMNKLFEWGIIKAGDMVEIKNYPNSEAAVIDTQKVKYKNEVMLFNRWGEKVTKWSSLNIYEWTILKESNRTLHKLRVDKMEELQNEKLD
ncbi:hypothetical protein [Wukongibacter sp. M2B1]|uniref:hypothetical protein n=1 Tax=Wukongibacter sp. M2B1 TaxID=3088895 RepID=UPI003D7B4BCD